LIERKIDDDEIDLREYIEVIRKRGKLIVLITLIFAALALVFSLLQKPLYEAKTTILIKSGGSSGSFSQLAGLAGLAGISLPSGGGNMDDLTKVLQSKAVAEKVMEDLHLRDRIEGWNNPNANYQKLISTVQGTLKKPKGDGDLVELTAEYSDPELAAEIANGYTDALTYYWNKLNYTEARKKKEYIESQLPRVEKDLSLAEQRLKSFTLLSPQGRSSSTGLLGTIAGAQLQGVEVQRLSRELDIQNSVYTMLRKEYETVKLEESKELQPFSVIDRAIKPEVKSKPKTRLNIAIGFIMGIFVGIFGAFFQEYWEKSGVGR
jgi:tyrosine-protein kinase Etk/Wzc